MQLFNPFKIRQAMYRAYIAYKNKEKAEVTDLHLLMSFCQAVAKRNYPRKIKKNPFMRFNLYRLSLNAAFVLESNGINMEEERKQLTCH